VTSSPLAPKHTESTAESILQAAAQVFADKGYDGARVEEIARAAKVNKATLYYQIGDKQALYEAIIHRIMSGMADEIEQEIATAPRASDKLRCLIQTLACHRGIARQFSSMMMREIADDGVRLQDPALQQMGRIFGLLHSILEQGVESGEFRQVNPMATHMLIIGSLMVYTGNESIRNRVVSLIDEDLGADADLPTEEMVNCLTDQILASVCKRG
jgi:AcrR family transcriptional regulator